MKIIPDKAEKAAMATLEIMVVLAKHFPSSHDEGRINADEGLSALAMAVGTLLRNYDDPEVLMDTFSEAAVDISQWDLGDLDAAVS
jgi:hypothetical protein